MAEKSWAFNLAGKQHTLKFEQGFSGKKKIHMDGNLVYESQGWMDTATEFPFEVEGHSIVLLIKSGLVDSYDLLVDDKSLKTGKIGPARVTVDETPDGLVLVYKNGRAAYAAALFIALVFTGISIFIFSSAISSGSLTLADMMYLPVVFLLVGLGLLYWSLVKIFNKTTLVVNQAGVSVKHTPIPWFGNRELQTADIEKLYCESYERKSRSGEGPIVVTMKFILYRICAQLINGRKIVLISELDKCYDALFVNRQLGRKLGKLVQSGLQNA